MADEIADGLAVDLGDELPEEIDETTRESSEESTTGEAKDEIVEELEVEEGAESVVEKQLHFKEVTKKYPKFFKDFPSLRHTFFRAQEYTKIFPTVDDAKEAAEKYERLGELESALSSGEVEDLTGVLKGFEELGENVISNVASNFLPALRKANQEAYYAAITPELQGFVRNLYDYGVRNENENLKNAGLLAAQHFFGDMKVASGEKNVAGREAPKKDDKLDNERKAFRNERYTALYNDVVKESDSKLSTAITTGLDPRGVMTEAVKEMAVERIIKEITKTLTSDRSHTSHMNNLWKRASAEGFSSSYKSRIISAYLERATEIMPSIRAKIRASILGTRKPEGDSVNNKVEERKEPRQTTGGARSQNGAGRKDGREIDWSRTTDVDYLKGKITYKS